MYTTLTRATTKELANRAAAIRVAMTGLGGALASSVISTVFRRSSSLLA
jgi:hypothetical protein